jgi:CubicO group peptidase (beta-lactamase class C family)
MMKKLFLLLSGFLFIAFCQFSCTQAPKYSLAEKAGISGDTLELATQKMQEYIDNGKLGGISALIYKNGEIVYREEFGNASLSEMKPMDETTIFRMFSMTKPVTAVALMTLFDEGKFTLDDKAFEIHS